MWIFTRKCKNYCLVQLQELQKLLFFFNFSNVFNVYSPWVALYPAWLNNILIMFYYFLPNLTWSRCVFLLKDNNSSFIFGEEVLIIYLSCIAIPTRSSSMWCPHPGEVSVNLTPYLMARSQPVFVSSTRDLRKQMFT